jgi:hypothetical protein
VTAAGDPVCVTAFCGALVGFAPGACGRGRPPVVVFRFFLPRDFGTIAPRMADSVSQILPNDYRGLAAVMDTRRK